MPGEGDAVTKARIPLRASRLVLPSTGITLAEFGNYPEPAAVETAATPALPWTAKIPQSSRRVKGGHMVSTFERAAGTPCILPSFAADFCATPPEDAVDRRNSADSLKRAGIVGLQCCSPTTKIACGEHDVSGNPYRTGFHGCDEAGKVVARRGR